MRALVPAAAVALVAALFGPGAVHAQAVAVADGTVYSDPVLEQLIEQSLAVLPELRQARDLARAERERIPQTGAFPDPALSVGIQNDGFRSIQIGKAETSFYAIDLSQPLPWPGKRGLRTRVASLGARRVEVYIERARLSAEADVRRAHLDLVLVRERLALLERLDTLWQKSAAIARRRYEAGEGAQSDVLRAQLELNRLRKRRWLLQAEAETQVQTLNRLRARPLDEPIRTLATLREVGAPRIEDAGVVLARARAQSPELTAAKLGVSRAEAQADLARRERFPDLSVNAGVMPRGDLEPMWRAGMSVGLPVWLHRKQRPAIREREARAAADAQGSTAIEQILRLRVAERRVALSALVQTIELYQDGLLVQSQATAESTLAQYGVGNVTFASVLEANAGYLNDEEDYLLAVAEAQRIAIAEAEITLDPVGVTARGDMSSAPLPAGSSSTPDPAAEAASSSPSM